MSIYRVGAACWVDRRTRHRAQPLGRLSRVSSVFGLSSLSSLSTLISLVALAAASAWCAPARAAAANGLAYSATPSNTEPHAACPPPTSDRAQCLAIIDPVAALPAALSGPAPTLGAPSTAGVLYKCFSGEYEYCGSGYDHGFAPQDLESAYKLPAMTGGEGQTVAIVDADDDPDAQADLKVYRSTYNLPPCEGSCFTKVNQEGGATYPEANSEWGFEISLDLDMVSAACPKCHILLVEADNNELKNLGLAEDEAVKLSATEISNSYGAREAEVGNKQLKEDTKYYMHPGVPITVAGGDHAYENDLDGNRKLGKCSNCSPNYPAGLSTVISVGGSELSPDKAVERGWTESVWSLSGSGCALYVAKPKWQTDKGCKNRTDNDVAAEAAFETPVSLYDTYARAAPGWQTSGGTSVASPLAAGAIALESSTMRSEGSEGIYKNPGNWFDVTAGKNWLSGEECAEEYLCNGEVGYDGPTGNGAPDDGATITQPSAVTEPASGTTEAGGTLDAVVDPEGSETAYYFQYGASISYGEEAPLGGVKLAATTVPEYVGQSLSGLLSGTLYHYRVVAVSAGGTAYSADRTFSTAPKVYQSKFGSQGSGEGRFEGPFDAAVDEHGDIWVTDYSNDRLEEYSATGGFLRACGSAGSGIGQFKGPTGIAINPGNGELFVSDSGNDRVEVVESNCTFRDEVIGAPGSGNGELSDPMGLALDANGELRQAILLVADSGNNRIEEFQSAGNVGEYVTSYGSTGTAEGQFKDPTDIILGEKENDSTDNYYIVDSGNDRIQEFTETGLRTPEKISTKARLQFGSSGAGKGEFSDPADIAVDPSTGDVDVTDTGNDRVEQFLPNGTYVATFGAAGGGSESFEAPKGIAVNTSGDLYIADYANDRMDVWGPSQEVAHEWQVTASPNPVKALNSLPYGISCASATACTMVGAYNTATESSAYKPFVESWNGAEWQLQSTPIPTGSSRTFLYGVSCMSTTACTTAGYYVNGAGTYLSLAERWNGAEWQIQTTPEPSGTKNSLLSSVSCTSSTACTAVGWYENGAGVEAPFAERWNGTAWSVQSAPSPSGVKASYPYTVSCSSSTVCTMAGKEVNGSGVRVPFAESWNGTEWSVQSMPSPSGATWTELNSVSCASSAACTAVGAYENSSHTDAPFAERWNGVEWSLQSPPAPAGGKSYLEGVSCTSATVCFAVGSFWNSAGKDVTLAERWSYGEWQIQPTPNGEGEEGSLYGGVSCSSPLSCAAAGGSNGKTLAEIYR